MGETVVHESGYDANFETDPPEYLKCVICTLVLRDPVMIVECGHRFCRGCYKNMKEYAKSVTIPFLCPLDKTEVVEDKVVDDKGITRAALDLKVKCDNFEQGCEWTGELRDLQAHVNKDCEKLDLRLMIMTLTKRLEDCETRLNNKDLEINKLQEELKTSKESKKNVNKRLAKCEELLKEREQQIGKLTNDLKSEMKQVKMSIVEAMNETKGNNDQGKKTAKKALKQAKKKQENNVGSAESLTESSPITLADDASTTQALSNAKSKKTVNDTKKDDKIEIEIRNMTDATILEWKVTNYSSKQALGETVFSPTFNTFLKDNPCRVALNWHGKLRGRLSIHLLFVHSTLIAYPFEITLIAFGENRKPFKVDSFTPNLTQMTIKPSGAICEGFGRDDFLIMPGMSHCVVNDVLSMKCLFTSSSEKTVILLS